MFTLFSLPVHSDQYVQGLRKEYPQSRAAPVYEELDAARRRVLDNDPNRVSVCFLKNLMGNAGAVLDLMLMERHTCVLVSTPGLL